MLMLVAFFQDGRAPGTTVWVMATHTKLKLDDIKDLAPEYGMEAMGEARFARDALGAERIGLSYYRMNAKQRVGFGHRHSQAEEAYLVLSGGGRFKVEDEVFDVSTRDVVYCAPTAMREWESGPDGMELLAIGAHAENDAEMHPGWWI